MPADGAAADGVRHGGSCVDQILAKASGAWWPGATWRRCACGCSRWAYSNGGACAGYATDGTDWAGDLAAGAGPDDDGARVAEVLEITPRGARRCSSG